MKSDEARAAESRRTTERQEQVPVQGTIESVGVRAVLRLALAHAPALLTLRAPTSAVTELWCSPDGLGTAEAATATDEALAEALALSAGTFEIAEAALPAVTLVPFAEAVAAAEALAPAWAQVVAAVPDPRAAVRLPRRLDAPAEMTAAQWRVLARVGTGRSLPELAELLGASARASRRAVAELVSVGLVEVVRVPVPLTAPPVGPALAPPSPPVATPPAATGPDDPAIAPSPSPAPVDEPVDEPVDDATDRWGDDVASIEDGAGWAESTAGAVAPVVDDSWSAAPPAPVAAPDGPAWDAGPGHEVVAVGWDSADRDDAPIEWDPEPASAPARPPAPAGFIEDPIGAGDEALGSAAGDEELVNRALLFKFLSSVRE